MYYLKACLDAEKMTSSNRLTCFCTSVTMALVKIVGNWHYYLSLHKNHHDSYKRGIIVTESGLFVWRCSSDSIKCFTVYAVLISLPSSTSLVYGIMLPFSTSDVTNIIVVFINMWQTHSQIEWSLTFLVCVDWICLLLSSWHHKVNKADY